MLPPHTTPTPGILPGLPSPSHQEHGPPLWACGPLPALGISVSCSGCDLLAPVTQASLKWLYPAQGLCAVCLRLAEPRWEGAQDLT